MTIPFSDIQTQLAELHRTLDRLSEANFAQQQRLAEALKFDCVCRQSPERLEFFLDGFVNMDLHISLLRKDLKSQESKIILSATEGDPAMLRLTKDVLKMSEEFARLKSDFESQLCPGCKV